MGFTRLEVQVIAAGRRRWGMALGTHEMGAVYAVSTGL
jgi:hypothetical protein